MKTAIGYIRVSTAGQAEEGISLEAQEAKIKAWCEFNGYELVDLHTDAGISGKSIDGREGLQAALNSIKPGQALVFYSLSRLARNTKDTIIISEQLNSKGCDLVSINEKIDTTSALGNFFFTMIAALGQLERDQISERTKSALSHKKSKGEFLGRVPYGYRLIDGELIEDIGEQAIVKAAREARQQGFSYRAIAEQLKKKGFKTRKGTNFQAMQVKRLAA